MLNKHLEQHRKEFKHVLCHFASIIVHNVSGIRNLDDDLKKSIYKIINRPGNIAPVPARINRGVRHRISMDNHNPLLTPI